MGDFKYHIHRVVYVIENDPLIIPSEKDVMYKDLLGYKNKANYKRSSVRRGSYPSGLNPLNFYEAVISRFYGAGTDICDFSVPLINLLEAEKLIPEEWAEKIEIIDGRHISLFDENEFRTFVTKLLLSDIEQKSMPAKKAGSRKKRIWSLDNYFEQMIYKEETKEGLFEISSSLEQSSADFQKLDDLGRILISAPGGQGKSLFLRRLEEKALEKKHYAQVLRIELTDLLALTEDEILRDLKDGNIILSYLIKNKEKNAEYQAFLESREKLLAGGESGKSLLLLDGYNELEASADFKRVNAILDELESINKKWLHATILMTTRPAKKNERVLDGYCCCGLSGTPPKKLEAFLAENKDISEEIKELAEIPMYYNILVKIKKSEKVNTKYDLLFRIYLERYNQSAKDEDSFFAFFVLAPYIAQEIHNNPKNRITMIAASEILKRLEKTNYELLLQIVLNECGYGDRSFKPNLSNACSILFHNGPIKYVADENHSPFVFSNDEYKIFHDDVRDFLIAFSAIITIKVMRAALEEEQYDVVKDIYLNLNLKDDPWTLIKSKLGVYEGKEMENLNDLFSILKITPISPQAIIFAHALFLISDYSNFGKSAVEPTHKMLIGFTERIIGQIKRDGLSSFFARIHDNFGADSVQRCKEALLDIISKHCEYYRSKEMFIEGIELINIAGQIQADNDGIINQKAKLLLLMYQSHIKDSRVYDLSRLGFRDYRELYFEGRKLLDEAVCRDFNLSVNVVGMLCSVPAPFLFEDQSNQIQFDFVKAFDLCRALIFTKRKKNYIAKEISYTVRQAVGLLLKGYVRYNPELGEYREGDPGEKSVVLGERNMLKTDKNTLRLAKELLKKAEGMSPPTLNFYRGVVACFYDENIPAAKKHFENEADSLLKSIFLRYNFGINADLDALYRDLFAKMKDPKQNTIDHCHPIYWYCDAKNLELAFDKKRRSFFDELEKEFCEGWKGIVEQLTQ